MEEMQRRTSDYQHF